VGAQVYLFAANTTGYGGNGIAASSSNASVSLLTNTAGTTLDTSGGATNGDYYVGTSGVTVSCPSGGCFTITGDYTCAAGAQVYLYALGGNAGGGTNAAAGLMAALGSCPMAGNFAAATPYIVVNEVSTVAAAYAMAGFATDATHVSSSGTALAQVGIANAFANAGNLETLATGVALATTPAGNGTVPQAEINTLANILAACVNSTGAVTGPTNPTACYTLFNDAESGGSSGAVPTDTATAAINLAHNPGSNVAGLYGLGSATPPFAPALSAQPNDFTVGLQFTGGGLSQPQAIAIDGSGNAWIPNFGNIAGVASNSITELSGLGSLLSGPNGYTGGGMDRPTTIAVDPSGNAWTLNPYVNALIEVSSTGSILSGTGGFTGGGLSVPGGLSIDGSGNIWITDGNTVSEFSNSGSPGSGSSYSAGGLGPSSTLAIDGSGDLWLPDTFSSRVTELSNSGSVLSGMNGYSGGGLNFPDAIAIDSSGDAWMLNSSDCTCTPGGSFHIVELSSSGSSLGGASGFLVTNLDGPTGIAIDGGDNVWITNFSSNAVTELTSPWTVASPPPSEYMGGGMNGPGGVAIDGSGDVWVANNGNKSVTEIIGAAVPVVTPLSVGVKNNALGTRP
jgi:hypothetical protein